MTAKSNKPAPFTGKDSSLAAVNAWIFRIKAYLRDVEDPAEKTEKAATYLTETAEQWFIAKYARLDPLPNFDDFLPAFKARFTRADDERQLRKRIESITQGTRSAVDYGTEFQTLMTEIGEDKVDMVWAKQHFERGLERRIQYSVVPHFTDEDTIDSMIDKAQRSFEFHQRMRLENPSKPPPVNRSPSAPGPSGTPRSTSVAPRLSKLTDAERDNLRANNGCFKCRKANAGHTSRECPHSWDTIQS